MPIGKVLTAAFAVLSLTVTMLPGTAMAEPRRPLFEMPYPCGATRQGATYNGHGNGNYPLDFNRGSGNDDLGDPVRASAGGRVQRYVRSDGAKIVVIHHNSEWATDYRHLSRFRVRDGAWVRQGQLIGHVGKTGTSYAHLHYEQQRKTGGDRVAQHIRFRGKPLNPPYYNRDTDGGGNGPDYTSRNCTVRDNSVSAVVGGQGNPWAFARRGDGRVIFKRRLPDRGWGNWNRIGGNIKGNPDATIRPNGQVRVVARNAGNRVVHRLRRTGGSWSAAWVKLSSFRVAYPPATVAVGKNRVIVFAVRASDHRVMRKSWKAGDGWGRWHRFSGRGGFTSGPDANVRAGGIVDVVVRDPGGRIAHRKRIPGNGWQKGWRAMASPVALNGAAPTVTSRKAGSVDIFARGAKGRLFRKTRTAAGTWRRWTKVGEVRAHFRAGPDAVAAGPRKLHVFGRNADGKAVWTTWRGNRPAGERWTPIRRIHGS